MCQAQRTYIDGTTSLVIIQRADHCLEDGSADQLGCELVLVGGYVRRNKVILEPEVVPRLYIGGEVDGLGAVRRICETDTLSETWMKKSSHDLNPMCVAGRDSMSIPVQNAGQGG